jgi:hypothetical protein
MNPNNIDVNEAKREIEDRYKRLSKGKRRPSLEYVSPQEIKDVFSKYVKEPDIFEKMSNEEILKFYQNWYEDYINSKNKED